MAVKRAAAPAAKKPVGKVAKKKSPAKGDKLVCETCGLGVVVDSVSGLAVFEELICCSVPMKPKKASASEKSTLKKAPTKK